jgi:hypothetical protein
MHHRRRGTPAGIRSGIRSRTLKLARFFFLFFRAVRTFALQVPQNSLVAHPALRARKSALWRSRLRLSHHRLPFFTPGFVFGLHNDRISICKSI